MQMRQRDVAALDAKYEGVSRYVPKMMLCDDVAAGRRRLHYQSSLSVREATTPPAWIISP